MTPTNAKLNGVFNDIRLIFEIEPKISEENKQMGHLKEKILP